MARLTNALLVTYGLLSLRQPASDEFLVALHVQAKAVSHL